MLLDTPLLDIVFIQFKKSNIVHLYIVIRIDRFQVLPIYKLSLISARDIKAFWKLHINKDDYLKDTR